MSNSAPSPGMQSPLYSFGLAAKARTMDATCGVWANEMPLLGYISLRGDASNASFTGGVSKALGLALPTEPCTLIQSASATALWLSPDEWMIVVPRTSLAAALKSLNEELTGVRSQVADNSGGYTQVLIQGADARDVLSHCTVYDLAHLTDGRIAGTTFGKTSVYMRKHRDGYVLMLRRSFADYIWRFLERAAQPYGFGVAKLSPGDTGSGAGS